MSVAPGISISVEDGTVGKISLSVPLWYGFGRVEAAIEAVEFVLKLDFNEPENINNLTGNHHTMDMVFFMLNSSFYFYVICSFWSVENT